MGIFKNELSWSFSRDKAFRECKRAYYYHYYASWGGWEDAAGDFTKKIYLLKQMKNLAMWRGEIVHSVIEWILKEKIEGRKISYEMAREKARGLLRSGWIESKNREWISGPKNCVNLFEHYYNKSIPKTRTDEVKDKVYGCIKNFYNSEFLKRLESVSHENFLHIEDIESFKYKGLKIYVSPDFAMKDGNYYLFDWKTGNPSGNDDLQLSCYALFGISKWNVPLTTIKVIPVYLKEKNIKFEPLKNVDIEGVKNYIDESSKDMRNILRDSARNIAEISDFPKTEDTGRCSSCFFQEVCK